MKHIEFKSFEEFFAYFELSKHCSCRLTSEESAYFEFNPYKGDNVILRGWIREFDTDEVQVSFKYKEFDLGRAVWSFDEAKTYIQNIDYFYAEED